MSTHINCPYCGTSEPIRVLTIPDEISPSVATALERLGRAATEVTLDFTQLESTCRGLKEMRGSLTPVDPSIHLAPNHRDYTPNHRKPRRGRYKGSGR